MVAEEHKRLFTYEIINKNLMITDIGRDDVRQ
jgi:hypothetical protein